ncbi:MAG TPA: hypothetical protein VIY86_07045, partial [Pirellulaceae bacterium]
PGAAKAIYDVFVSGKDPFTQRPFYPGEKVNAPVYLPGVGEIGSKSQYLLEQILPGLAKVRAVLPTTEKDAQKSFRRRLSSFTGLQVYPVDKGLKAGASYERMEPLLALLKMLKDQGVEVGTLPGKNPLSKTGGTSSGTGYYDK